MFRDLLVTWIATAVSLSLVTYLGIRIADLLIDHHWHWW